jgi:hypothetical protein
MLTRLSFRVRRRVAVCNAQENGPRLSASMTRGPRRGAAGGGQQAAQQQHGASATAARAAPAATGTIGDVLSYGITVVNVGTQEWYHPKALLQAHGKDPSKSLHKWEDQVFGRGEQPFRSARAQLVDVGSRQLVRCVNAAGVCAILRLLHDPEGLHQREEAAAAVEAAAADFHVALGEPEAELAGSEEEEEEHELPDYESGEEAGTAAAAAQRAAQPQHAWHAPQQRRLDYRSARPPRPPRSALERVAAHMTYLRAKALDAVQAASKPDTKVGFVAAVDADVGQCALRV